VEREKRITRKKGGTLSVAITNADWCRRGRKKGNVAKREDKKGHVLGAFQRNTGPQVYVKRKTKSSLGRVCKRPRIGKGKRREVTGQGGEEKALTPQAKRKCAPGASQYLEQVTEKPRKDCLPRSLFADPAGRAPAKLYLGRKGYPTSRKIMKERVDSLKRDRFTD